MRQRRDEPEATQERFCRTAAHGDVGIELGLYRAPTGGKALSSSRQFG
jgi:hypothetical protein